MADMNNRSNNRGNQQGITIPPPPSQKKKGKKKVQKEVWQRVTREVIPISTYIQFYKVYRKSGANKSKIK